MLKSNLVLTFKKISHSAFQIAQKNYRALPIPKQTKLTLKKLIFKLPGLPKLIWKIKHKKYFDSQIQFIKDNEINLAESFSFKDTSDPLVSIIIPVYNNIRYTYTCLKSLHKTPSRYRYEIIVVDDCSTDNTQEILSTIGGIRIVKNEKNSGFILTCTKGAELANGKYLLFLNNDTQVLLHALDELVDTFVLYPEAGLVGSKLIYPNGQLQEAGGIVWQDGSAWNYGRYDDPNKPVYNYLREIDYCSGASIMVPKKIFEEVGGFDKRYLPAYCEDSDVAFAIRDKGYKTFYQPLSQIIHFEGITSGTDLTKGVKAYQVTNSIKFREKWQATLAWHRANGDNPYLEKERNIQKRILMIDAYIPTPDQDAGSVTAFFYIKALIALGFKITFIPMNGFLYQEKYTQDLQRLGVECLYAPYVCDVATYLKQFGTYFNVVMLNRVHCANACINDVKQYCPKAKVIFNTTDLHYLRLERQAEIEKLASLAKEAAETKQIEFSVMKKSDCTIIVSEIEKEFIAKEAKEINTCLIPLVLEINGNKTDFSQRKDIVFIGGYQHAPNVDAVLYFVNDIWPLVKAKMSDIKFYILGSHVTNQIKALANDDIKVIGYVKELADYFNHCCLSIAPLRYGAGIKGKMGMSMSYGVPCVATSIAAEGMGLKNGEETLIADEPNAFACAIEKLQSDEAFWNKLSMNGLAFVEKHYSLDAGKEKIAALFEQLGV